MSERVNMGPNPNSCCQVSVSMGFMLTLSRNLRNSCKSSFTSPLALITLGVEEDEHQLVLDGCLRKAIRACEWGTWTMKLSEFAEE
jgi:hypothetical protein